MLGIDAILMGPHSLAARNIKQVTHANLGKDQGAIADCFLQNAEERSLGGSQQAGLRSIGQSGFFGFHRKVKAKESQHESQATTSLEIVRHSWFTTIQASTSRFRSVIARGSFTDTRSQSTQFFSAICQWTRINVAGKRLPFVAETPKQPGQFLGLEQSLRQGIPEASESYID